MSCIQGPPPSTVFSKLFTSRVAARIIEANVVLKAQKLATTKPYKSPPPSLPIASGDSVDPIEDWPCIVAEVKKNRLYPSTPYPKILTSSAKEIADEPLQDTADDFELLAKMSQYAKSVKAKKMVDDEIFKALEHKETSSLVAKSNKPSQLFEIDNDDEMNDSASENESCQSVYDYKVGQSDHDDYIELQSSSPTLVLANQPAIDSTELSWDSKSVDGDEIDVYRFSYNMHLKHAKEKEEQVDQLDVEISILQGRLNDMKRRRIEKHKKLVSHQQAMQKIKSQHLFR